jgi:hypothetical protein
LITGFNTDIEYNEKTYHIQTEDKGLQNPFIESLVYVGGEILACKKTSYAKHVEEGADEKWIGDLMEQQHRTMIAAIKRGRLAQATDPTETQSAAPKRAAVVDDIVLPALEDPQEEKTLDQVIIDYLASEAEREHLELVLISQTELVSGLPAEIRIEAKKSISQQPIVGAAVEVKLISTVEAPQILFKGKTAADGGATIRCNIPAFREGTAAVIVSAHSSLGNDEVKQLVKRRK